MTSVGELKSVVRPVTGKAPSFEGEQFRLSPMCLMRS